MTRSTTAMFDTGLLKRLRYLSLLAQAAGGRSLVAAAGGRTEAAGLRDYAPGDDYRHIDWTLCARRDELLTRTFAADEDRHVYLLVDCSASMGLGRPSKFDVARRVAAALGYAALADLSCLSLLGFSDGIVAEDLPLRGKGRTAKLLGLLNRLKLQGSRTDLTRAAKGLAGRRRRPGPVVVISDLYDPNGFRRGLDVLRGSGYEPRVVQIYAAAEADPGLLGDVELFDVEAKTTRRVTITERAAKRYRELFARFQRSVRRHCAKHGMTCLQIASDTPVDEVLLTVLGAKETTTTKALETR